MLLWIIKYKFIQIVKEVTIILDIIFLKLWTLEVTFEFLILKEDLQAWNSWTPLSLSF